MSAKARGSAASSRKKKASLPAVTESGIALKNCYTPADLKQQGFSYRSHLGDPGQFPYTRGTRDCLDRNQPFNLRQYVGFGTVKESNRLFRNLVCFSGRNRVCVRQVRKQEENKKFINCSM